MDIQQVLEIDEEGYPMFSGIRSQDEDLNREILSNIRRSDPSRLSSRLWTHFDGGKAAWIQAFDSPLVAQSVVLVNGDLDQPVRLKLHFPGGFQDEISLSEIECDAFDRLHTFLGPDKVPVVFSRKAQASLLHQPGIPEKLVPKVFRSSDSPAHHAKFWTELYANGGDRWELGQCAPPFSKRIAKMKLPDKGKIAVPAAGRGHEAKFLEELGFEVHALDFAAAAEAEYRRLYPNSKIHYEICDALSFLESRPEFFDGILEHTFYCAIPPSDRPRYWTAASAALKKGAPLFGLYYLKTHPGGPPFGTSQWEIRQFAERNFDIRKWEIAEDSTPERFGEEIWVELVKR